MRNSVYLGLTINTFVDLNGKKSLKNREKRIAGLEPNRCRFWGLVGHFGSLFGYVMLGKF